MKAQLLFDTIAFVQFYPFDISMSQGETVTLQNHLLLLGRGHC